MDPEHESIREQMREDFKTVMVGLATQRGALMNAIAPINATVGSLSTTVDALKTIVAMLMQNVTMLAQNVSEMGTALETFKVETGKAFDAQADLLKGYVERTDERLASLFENDDAHETRLAKLEARVDALETRIA